MCSRHFHLMLRRLPTAVALGLLVPAIALAQPVTTLVSVATDGNLSNNSSGRAAISADGRWVAFMSAADNLVPDDTNFQWDVFLHDRQTGTTTRVSVQPGGGQMTVPSDNPAISADGRWVAFQSGSPLGTTQVFLHDRDTGTTTLVSVGLGGVAADGWFPAISADGRWIAFASRADNLVAGDTNGADDVFVYDRLTAVVTRVSVGSGGTQGNSYSWSRGPLSADGRWVAFASMASNLVPDDTNADWDVFVHDRQTGATTRVSVGPGGAQGNRGSLNAAISADGRWVVFASRASNLVAGDTNGREDVFLHDRQTRTTTGVSIALGNVPGNGDSSWPAISADGRLVAFHSVASNLVAGDTNGSADVFVRDMPAGVTARVSVGIGGGQAAGSSVAPSLSADGRLVAFESAAGNLVAGDANFQWDVFAHDRGDTGCGAALVPASVHTLAAATTGHLLVLTSAGCPWTALSNAPDWLTVTGGASGTGFGIVEYSAATNAGDARTGTITIGNSNFTVNQADPLTPATPVGLVAHTVVGDLVTLRWTMPPGGPQPTSFVLEGGLYPGEVLASIPTGSAFPTFTFTAPAGSFYARVHALNGAFRSAASNEIRLHVDVPVAPSPPGHLLSVVDGSNVGLTWTNTYEGGAPTSLVLDVSGVVVATIPLPLSDHAAFLNVPGGPYVGNTYRIGLRARNAAGSSQPSALTLRVPVQCSGPPAVPASMLAYRVGSTVYVDWAPGPSGAAPTSYVLDVTGTLVGQYSTPERAVSALLQAGTYTVTVAAVNPCGASAATPPQTVVVP